MQVMASHRNNARNNGASGSKGKQTRQQEKDEEFTYCLREYMVLSKAFHATMSFKDFFNIKHPKWYEPQVSLDKKVKVPRKNLLVFQDVDASKNEYMGTHEALEPETIKDIWEYRKKK
jgi:hypothetical protein